jgi:ligand-binding SRPBCC domain-containing protein
MVQHFETSQWVPFPVELVFAFFANPHNLPPLMPPRLKVRIDQMRLKPPPPRPIAADPARRFQSPAAGFGSEFLISFTPIRWLPRASWTARIVEFEWNSHFVDKMASGPFKSFRHRHEIVSATENGQEGTSITDAIDFELPAGFLNALASSRVWSQLQESFVFRQKRLPEILAIAARQAARKP